MISKHHGLLTPNPSEIPQLTKYAQIAAKPPFININKPLFTCAWFVNLAFAAPNENSVNAVNMHALTNNASSDPLFANLPIK